MLRFEGVREVAGLGREHIFCRLSHAPFLASCVPDVEETNELSDEKAILVIRPGFAFMKGHLEVTMVLAEQSAPASIVWQLQSKGVGTTAEVRAAISLAEAESGTSIQWFAEVLKLGGLLKMVPTGLIRGAAEKVINDVWNQVLIRLQADASPPDPVVPE